MGTDLRSPLGRALRWGVANYVPGTHCLSGPLQLPVSGLLNGLMCGVQFLEPGSLGNGKRKSCDVAMD